MKIGVPKEIKPAENRVAMTPHGVASMIQNGHEVIVQKGAGVNSGFEDSLYKASGALLAPTPNAIFETADMIVKVKEPQPVELTMIRPGQIVFTYFHFAASEELTRSFLNTKAIAIAYETVELNDGSLPLLIPMSEVAGRMATQEGARFLEHFNGGRGILLGGVPGVPPAVVTILGGGIVGTNAAKIAAGMGATVHILDINVNRLRYLEDIMPENVLTVCSNRYHIEELLPLTDLLIGAVLIVGAKAPNLVTRDMLKLMRKRSVIVDVAVDQGGCVETIHPTTHENPTYLVDDVVHYGVSNMPGAVPFTSTIALTNVTLPYIQKIANQGFEQCLAESREIQTGVNIFHGHVTHAHVADTFTLPYTPIRQI
ncbi:alanine dehydrogenase [bacterium]|nr:alanine dehydrogenase [bacterium]